MKKVITISRKLRVPSGSHMQSHEDIEKYLNAGYELSNTLLTSVPHPSNEASMQIVFVLTKELQGFDALHETTR